MTPEPSYLKAMRPLVVEIFRFLALADLKTPKDISEKSGLAVSTVYRLLTQETVFPQFRTLYLLARAAGCEVKVERMVQGARKKRRAA